MPAGYFITRDHTLQAKNYSLMAFNDTAGDQRVK